MTTNTAHNITVWESGPSEPEVHVIPNARYGSYDIAIVIDGGYGSLEDAARMAHFWMEDLKREGIPVKYGVGMPA